MDINKIYQGDCKDVLKDIDSNSINCVVTSPPYWGLRDYGTAKWEGGDPKCDHKHYLGEHGELSVIQVKSKGTQQYQYKDICSKCGAKRVDDQLGLEKTPEEYVQKLVDIFREVKRVLRKDGTVWLNLGDSYAGFGKASGQKPEHKNCGKIKQKRGYDVPKPTPSRDIGLKPKDLCMIPARVAMALQADGWYLRSDIIWNKRNPMPESVTDRPTKSHEYIFLLSKSAKYYYDTDAIAEKTTTRDNSDRDRDNSKLNNVPGRSRMAGLKTNDYEKRNKRSVWTVNTKPFSEAHFAVFPGKLIEDCIKAGCPIGGIVLDPFIGSGTTAIVARKQDKNYIGIELNEEYIKMAQNRISKELGLFE